jgi:hypothetical protein
VGQNLNAMGGMIRIKLFMEGKEMDLQTLILAMSIPSAVTGFCFWLIEEKIKKQQKETEEKEKIREKSEVLIIKSVMASIALGEATATAIKNGHANGETEAALQYAREIKHEQKDFLTEQGIRGIY